MKGHIRYQRSGQAALEQCEFLIEEVSKGTEPVLQQLAFSPQAQSSPDQYTLRVLHNGSFVAGQDFTRERLRVFGFEKPLRVRPGDELILIASAQPGGKVKIDLDQYQTLNLGALCEIQPIAIAPPNYSVSLINLLPLRQIISLEFKHSGSAPYSVYLNGTRMPETSLTGEAIPVLLQNSPLPPSDYQWLRGIHGGIQSAVQRAARNPDRQDLLKQLWQLQEDANRVTEQDNLLRGVRIDVLSPVAEAAPRPGTGADRQRMTRDLEALKQSVANFRQNLSRYAGDPVLAAQIMGDLLPLQMQVTHSSIDQETSQVTVNVQISKNAEVALEGRTSLSAPGEWQVEALSDASFSARDAAKTISFQVTPTSSLWQRKVPLTAVLSGTWQNYPFRREVAFAVGHDFLKEWMIIGPFPNLNGAGFEHSFPAQQNIKINETYDGIDQSVKWRQQTFEDGYVNFDTAFTPNDNAVAFAYVGIFSPREQNVRLEFGADGDMKIFNNYKEIFSRRNLSRSTPAAQILFTKLYNGWNHILVKVSDTSGPWGFYFEITDLYGLPLIDLKYAFDKAG
jgi:hypothetical protein